MRIAPRPFGQVLGDGINSLARSWRALISPALWAFIPAGAIGIAVFELMDADAFLDLVFNDPDYLETLPTDVIFELATPFLQATAVAVLVQMLAALFVYLASHHVIATDAAGYAVSGAEARRFAIRRYGRGLVAGVIVVLVVGGILTAGLAAWSVPFSLVGTPNETSVLIALILLAALLAPAIWLGVSLSMWSSVVAIEHRGILVSLRRSLRLVRGRWWSTLGFLLMVGLLGSVAIQLIQLVAIPLTQVGDLGLGVSIASIIGIAAQGLIVAGIAAMYTTWYIDLRARAEDLVSDDLM